MAVVLAATVPIGPLRALPQDGKSAAAPCPAAPNGTAPNGIERDPIENAGAQAADDELVRGDGADAGVSAFSPCFARPDAGLAAGVGASGLAETVPPGAGAKSLDPRHFVDGDADDEPAGELMTVDSTQAASEQEMQDQLVFYGQLLNIGAVSLGAVCLFALVFAWRRGIGMTPPKDPPSPNRG